MIPECGAVRMSTIDFAAILNLKILNPCHSDRQRRIPVAKVDFISLLGFFTSLRYVQNDSCRAIILH